MKPVIWQGCYNEGWKGVITPEAFAHPAKFSRGLIRRILDHMLVRGYVKRGDTIGDPFGGIGTGGIEAAYRGLCWVGVELEEKFVGLARKNFALHNSKWAVLGLPGPDIIQGDSRRFDVAVRAVVTSPPFTQDQPCASQTRLCGNIQGREKRDRQMGSEGNIQGLVGGALAVVISSPPYSDISAGAGGLNTKPARKAGQDCGRNPNSPSQSFSDDRYGDDPAQIAKLQDKGVEAVITSPPFRDARSDTTRPNPPATMDGTLADGRIHRLSKVAYGAADGQIDNLATGGVDSVVTSPPFASSTQVNSSPNDMTAGRAEWAGGNDAAKRVKQDYHGPSSKGQIGREAGETYWQAMLQVYSACYRSIKPGGYIAVVVKDYVKNKAWVPLCDDTLRLLCHVGFTPVERMHAMLVEETSHAQLFGADHVTRKERKSFFRRLAEKKGSPRIDYEEVLVCRRPE